MTDATNYATRPSVHVDDYSRRAAINQAIADFVEARRRPHADVGETREPSSGALAVGSVASSNGSGKSCDRISLGPVADRVVSLACWSGWLVLGVSIAHVAWLAVLKL
jgi:hypothetical protein